MLYKVCAFIWLFPFTSLVIAIRRSIRSTNLLPELLDRHVRFGVLLHHLRDGHLEILLGDVESSLTQRVPYRESKSIKSGIERRRTGERRAKRKKPGIREEKNGRRRRGEAAKERERREENEDEGYMPASVHVPLTSAPEAPVIVSAIFFRLIPRVRFIFREWIFKISSTSHRSSERGEAEEVRKKAKRRRKRERRRVIGKEGEG